MSSFTNFSLEGKIALVTGASYGIGFAIASAYAEAGATICFNDINQELVDKGLAAYEEKGIKDDNLVNDYASVINHECDRYLCGREKGAAAEPVVFKILCNDRRRK